MHQSNTVSSADLYVQRLDLGTDPFAEGYCSDYFYGGGQRRQVLDQVLHFSRYSDQAVLLVGGTGCGTSTLLAQLLDQISPLMDFCTVDAESVASPDQVLKVLSTQLRFEKVDSVTGFIAALRHNEEMEEDRDPVLVAIDQAHFLSIECLELLRQLYEHAGGSLHLLLIGEYQVEQLVKLAGFEAGALKVLELEPLDAAETGEYVLGLLQSVGYAGDQPLSTDQVAILHEQSGGNITEINLLAPALLGAKSKTSGPRINFAIPYAHLVAVVILVIAIGLSYWYQGSEPGGNRAMKQVAVQLPRDHRQVVKPEKPVAVEPPKVADAKSGPQQGIIDRQAAGRETAPRPDREKPALPPAHRAVPSPGHEVPNTKSNAALADRTSSSKPGISTVTAPAAENSPSRAVPGKAIAEPTPAIRRPVAGSIATSATSAEKKEVAINTAPVGTIPARPTAVKPAPVNPPPSASPVSVSQRTTPPLRTQKPPVKKPVARAPVKPAAAAIPPRERHLLAMDGNAFLLQLMGSIHEDRARAMVKTYVGRLPITYFESRRKGKPWFVVVTGPYQNAQAAHEGVKGLPKKLQHEQPWVRRVSGVKREILANRH